MLEAVLPFPAVGQNSTPIGLKGHQVGNFMDQGNQKSIFVQGSIDGNLVQAVGQPPIVPVPGDPMVHDLEMHPMGLDQFKTRAHGPIWEVFLKDAIHYDKGSLLLGNVLRGTVADLQ